jgi:hypothetical protein
MRQRVGDEPNRSHIVVRHSCALLAAESAEPEPQLSRTQTCRIGLGPIPFILIRILFVRYFSGRRLVKILRVRSNLMLPFANVGASGRNDPVAGWPNDCRFGIVLIGSSPITTAISKLPA